MVATVSAFLTVGLSRKASVVSPPRRDNSNAVALKEEPTVGKALTVATHYPLDTKGTHNYVAIYPH